MSVTRIWTDASVTSDGGGWGALILHKGKFTRHRGAFKLSHLPHECERLAMINAIHIAGKLGALSSSRT